MNSPLTFNFVLFVTLFLHKEYQLVGATTCKKDMRFPIDCDYVLCQIPVIIIIFSFTVMAIVEKCLVM